VARSSSLLPLARRDGLVIHEVSEETLVYDLRRQRAYCLNRTAALVWDHCDGRTAVTDVAAALQRELDRPMDEEVVHLALRRLERAHLLEGAWMAPSAGRGGISRREFLQKVGIAGAAAALLPTVVSIIAPTAAQALSCIVVSCSGGGGTCPVGSTEGQLCNPPNCTCTCQAVGQGLKCRA
jgi:hypothetical protein